MSKFVPQPRRIAGVALSAGLAVALSGVVAPAASAATTATVSTTRVVSATATANTTSAPWFRDPRTPEQRKAQLRVPRDPQRYRGAARETRAIYRTGDGALAVPARSAVGHQLTRNQAVTLDGAGLFRRGSAVPTLAARKQIDRLARSLTRAASLRCEGHADYSGSVPRAKKRAQLRADRVCARLERAAGRTSLRTSTISHGSARPAVVGGLLRDRRINNRVTVTVTRVMHTAKRPEPPRAPEPPLRQTVPSAPRLDRAEGVLGGVTYVFAAPAADGRSPVTGYEVTTGGGWSTVEPSATPAGEGLIRGEITGLTPGTSVTIQVRARNEAGAGVPSSELTATAFGLPTAPTAVKALGDDGTITTTFAAPASDGGVAVESFEISYDDATTWTDAETAGTGPWTLTKTGFRNGDTYDVHVRAVNRFGPGSSVTREVLVATVPGAPTLAAPEVEGTTAILTFQAPAFDGGTPVTSYEVTRDGGDTWVPVTVTEVEGGFTAELDGLAYGGQYDVRVRATNERGAGAGSAARTVTLVTVPDAPSNLVATASDTTVTLTFTAPASDGGTPITGYEVKIDTGDWAAATATDGAITLVGQAPGTRVYAVRAVNAVGVSPSATSNEIEILAPGPRAYRSEYYYSDGQVWTYVFYTTVPGAVGYEARLDGGAWLPVRPEADWISEQLGRIDDPVCAATACTGDRTVQVRAVLPDGYGAPGNVFPVTYYVLG